MPLSKPVMRLLSQINPGTAQYDLGQKLSDEVDAAASGLVDGAVTNAKLAAGIKIGALAELTTTDKEDVVSAINEVKGVADGAAAAVLDLGSVRGGKVTQNGSGTLSVVFDDPTSAAVSTGAGPTFNMTTPGNGGTTILTMHAGGAQTKTWAFAAATSVSDASPSTDISGGSDTKFKISVDGDVAETVTLTLSGLSSGAAIAAAMQAGIRALGGKKALVTVVYTTVYTITTATKGTGSAVVITPGATVNVAAALKLGAASGGTETAGTGDAVNMAAVTLAEVAAKLAFTNAVVTVTGGAVLITDNVTGGPSIITMGNGTFNTVFGLTNAEKYHGVAGLGYETDMADALYQVMATLNGVAQGSVAGKGLSVGNRATTGFDLYCEDATATADVDVLVFGTAAAP